MYTLHPYLHLAYTDPSFELNKQSEKLLSYADTMRKLFELDKQDEKF